MTVVDTAAILAGVGAFASLQKKRDSDQRRLVPAADRRGKRAQKQIIALARLPHSRRPRRADIDVDDGPRRPPRGRHRTSIRTGELLPPPGRGIARPRPSLVLLVPARETDAPGLGTYGLLTPAAIFVLARERMWAGGSGSIFPKPAGR